MRKDGDEVAETPMLNRPADSVGGGAARIATRIVSQSPGPGNGPRTELVLAGAESDVTPSLYERRRRRQVEDDTACRHDDVDSQGAIVRAGPSPGVRAQTARNRSSCMRT